MHNKKVLILKLAYADGSVEVKLCFNDFNVKDPKLKLDNKTGIQTLTIIYNYSELS